MTASNDFRVTFVTNVTVSQQFVVDNVAHASKQKLSSTLRQISEMLEDLQRALIAQCLHDAITEVTQYVGG